MFEMVIFDCDGTLVDSETLNNFAVSKVLIEAGHAHYTPELVTEKFIGYRLSEVFEKVEREVGQDLPHDIVQRVIDACHLHAVDYIKPQSHITEVVDVISKMTKMCVASNGERSNVVDSLAQTGLHIYFPDEHVFTAAMVARGKPAPDLFYHAADQMGVARDKCLVIEDSEAGMGAAKAAGMKAVGFTGFAHAPEESHKALTALEADLVTDNFADILKVLKARG